MANPRPDPFVLARASTPIGRALLVVDGEGHLRALDWKEHETRLRHLLQMQYGPGVAMRDGKAPLAVLEPLEAYFAGDLDALRSIRVATAGTPFQRRVWSALREIPAGTTLSYGALARRIGRPAAVRAVGAANGANPVSVVVPCHRLVGADGDLTGYGGGLERKRWLLAHEGVALSPPTARRRGTV